MPQQNDFPFRRSVAEVGPAAEMRGRIAACLGPGRDRAALERDWRALEARSDGSFFLSWLWLGTLLDHLPADKAPDVFRLNGPSGPAVLALLFPGRQRWRGTIPVRSLHLNTTGVPEYDQIYSEYNGLLCDRALDPAARMEAIQDLVRLTRGWHQLDLPGVTASFAEALAQQSGAALEIHDRKRTYQADLSHDRTDPIAQLGKSTRTALRRSQRFYAHRGELDLRVAADPQAALEYFEEMVALHQAHWRLRGKPGAFAASWSLGFHRDLIARGTASGTVCMTRVAAGGRVLGILYNIRWRSRLLNYQSGFAYEDDRDARPGVIVHYLAMQRARAQGAACYDFLAGDNQLKKTLGRPGEELVWGRLRRDKLLYSADQLGKLLRRLLSHR